MDHCGRTREELVLGGGAHGSPLPHLLTLTGTLEVDLLSVPPHAKVPHRCSSKQLPEVNPKAETVSLFRHRRVRGWWPVMRHVSGGNGAYKLLAVSTCQRSALYLLQKGVKLNVVI